jgi:hypothetical protein
MTLKHTKSEGSHDKWAIELAQYVNGTLSTITDTWGSCDNFFYEDLDQIIIIITGVDLFYKNKSLNYT